MQLKKILTTTVLAGATALGAATTATAADLTGPYFGGSYGAYRFKDVNLDEEDTMWKAFVGMHATNWLAIEAGYTEFDEASKQGSTFDAEGLTAAALLTFPIAQKSAFFVKGGWYWWDAQRTGSVNVDTDNSDPFYGAGFRIGLAENFSLRLEYERYEIVETSIDTATVGLQANF